jgi:hypothetical protein
MHTPHDQPRLYWSRDGRTGSSQRAPGGDRYLITRWDSRWLIHYIPAPGYPGVAQQMQRVPWMGERRTLRAAQQSCTAHAHRAAEKARTLAEQSEREFTERGF